MKIIFDSEEQKEIFLYELATVDSCPSMIKLNDTCDFQDSVDHSNSCKRCWENAIECEVNSYGHN